MPPKKISVLESFLRQFWLITSLLIILYIGVFGWSMIKAPDTLQVQYTPDDGYYYLGLARNFVRYGWWTFDSQNPTSGYHPLWAYLLAGIYWLGRPTDDQFVRWGLTLCSIITLTTTILMWWDNKKLSNPTYIYLVIACLISSPNFVINSISITEWALLILCAYLYFTRWYQNNQYTPILLYGIALAGSLARSDFVLLPFVLFFINLVTYYFDRNRHVLHRAIFGLFGSVTGLLLAGINNYIFTGQFLQSSAIIKAYWAKLYKLAYLDSISLMSDVLGLSHLPLQLKLAVFILVSVTAAYFLGKSIWHWDKNHIQELVPALGAGTALVGYTFFYFFNGALQPWYTGNLFIPILVLGALAIRFIWNRYKPGAQIVISVLALILIIHNIVKVVPIGINTSPWPHQIIMLTAGKYLRQNPLDGVVASWNAGIIGYYQGGTVVNLDGLVNDHIYPYMINNDLYSYITMNNYKYLIDFENMIRSQFLRLLGGYDDIRFINCLRPIKVFDDGQYMWQHLTLYEICQ